ncbi:hypothetical protein GDO81_019202, partial [Engystomops pustulosus]
AVSNRFCEAWMQVFLSACDAGNPFLFRQKLENFKLKVIQDMNILKRLIRQAESSHYSLFRCYNFLKNCGNGDLLLRIVKVELPEVPIVILLHVPLTVTPGHLAGGCAEGTGRMTTTPTLSPYSDTLLSKNFRGHTGQNHVTPPLCALQVWSCERPHRAPNK